MIAHGAVTPQQARHWAESIGLNLRYDVDLERLAALNAPFVRFDGDETFATYAREARTHRHGWLKTRLHRFLRSFFSDFDINGVLGTYPMHVLSTPQWNELLEHPQNVGSLLDVGSGRGDVLGQLAPLFSKVTATETSRGMARRLRRQGYEVLHADIAAGLPGRRFDAVSMLNVLDRCDRPLSLLATARMALKPGGLLLIALVLPYHPFVYEGGHSRPPKERLPIRSERFEDAAVEFVSLALLSLGLELVALSRVPYLSGGDAHRPLYELDDLVVVCRAIGEPPPILGNSAP